jgi:hypothetical protein
VSYVRKEIQLLGGGFNLLPPGDKTPITDYLLAQNWRTGQQGKLLSRWGYPQKFALNGPAYAHSGACSGGVNGDYYIAANAATGPHPCAIYVDPDHITTPIISGLSGGRVGMVQMNGWMWIMDSQVQGRHRASTGFRSWGIGAPGSGVSTTGTGMCTAAVGAANPSGPVGPTYQFYCTFETADASYETNPGPPTAPLAVALHDVNLSAFPVSTDPLMVGGAVNIYATGGTLVSPYLVQTALNAVSAPAVVWSTNDLTVTNQGFVMPTTNDLPPAGSGMVGPYFSRLYAWKGSRLFYTEPNLPQYWPGSADNQIGNWVNVGLDGEDIMWVTIHANVLVIYKERSIWYLAGDPDTGTLEILEDGTGLVSPFAVVCAGAYDYFVAPNSLRRCSPNLGRTEDISGEIRPLFTSHSVNAGPLTTPGNILPGSLWVAGVTSLDAYAIALGFAMGKLYVSYSENVAAGSSSVLLVYEEQAKRWLYHRNGLGTQRFTGFLFDGVMMQGLTGDGVSTALSYNLDDFRIFYVQDEHPGSPVPIECVYQSHYEDCGLPDNQKCWLEFVIDYAIKGADTANVAVGFDNLPAAVIGTLASTAGARKSQNFPLGASGTLAKNISIAFDCLTTDQVEIHNVYLYYYVEARLALVASSIPTDLGSGLVKQCKELMLDVDATYGDVNVSLSSDLPGNAIAVRQTPTVATGGRAVWKYPFPVTEGFLWKLALNAVTGPFRLYGARLLMRVIGVYVEAYEAAAGFVWDSMELTFESGITHVPRAYAIALAATPVKQFRELSFEIDTFNADVTVDFLTDLPTNVQTVRNTWTVNTGTAGRRFVRLTIAAGFNPTVIGRMCRIRIHGINKFILYEMSVEVLAQGLYIEDYEGAGGAVWDSREQDFGSQKPKEAREIEIDCDIPAGLGNVTAVLYSDLPGYTMAAVYTSAAITTIGRQKIVLPLTTGAAPFDYPIGINWRLIVGGGSSFAQYGARLKVRELGTYLTSLEVLGGGVWDSTPLDLGTERYKDFRRLEFDVLTDTTGTATLNLYTDQNGTMALQFTTTITTSAARKTVRIPLTPGIRGRLVQVEIVGAGVRLFSGRIWWRAMNDAKAEWAWFELPIEPTPAVFSWVPFPVNPTASTPEQWFWAKVLSVDETENKWAWVDVSIADVAA